MYLSKTKLIVIVCRSCLQKYAPLEWTGLFDKEEDVCIPDSNDVSFVLSLIATFFPLLKSSNAVYQCIGISCIHGRDRGTCCFLFTWRWLFWVCFFFFFSCKQYLQHELRFLLKNVSLKCLDN
jgi:sterol desaturase/sphingolipid hydroxylase (fatty acid hydroxylase superfamily)